MLLRGRSSNGTNLGTPFCPHLWTYSTFQEMLAYIFIYAVCVLSVGVYVCFVVRSERMTGSSGHCRMACKCEYVNVLACDCVFASKDTWRSLARNVKSKSRAALDWSSSALSIIRRHETSTNAGNCPMRLVVTTEW